MTSASVSELKVWPSASSEPLSSRKFSTIPLRTIASLPSSQPVSGCAFSSQTRPWVAQRVWPSPVVDAEPFGLAARFRFWRLPTARTYSRPSSSRSAIPAESYPRYSRRSRPLRRSSLLARCPTYPMMPHTLKLLSYPPLPGETTSPDFRTRPLRTARARLFSPPLRRDRSAELSSYESRDPSTEFLRFSSGLGFGKDADYRLRAGWAHQDSPAVGEFRVQELDLGEHRLRKLEPRHAYVVLRLGVAGHHGGRLGERAPFERAAE